MPQTLPMQMHDGMQSNKATTVCLSDEPQQSLPAACQSQIQEGQSQGQMQMQGQRQRQSQEQGQSQRHHQGQMQGQGQQQGQPSGGETEAELAAVEQGLSALEQQITAAALRYASQNQAVLCRLHVYGQDYAHMCVCATTVAC